MYVLLISAMPLVLILSWLILRFAPRSRSVPAWFFKVWLGVLVASGVVAAFTLAAASPNPDLDLSHGMFFVVLVVSSVVTAFTLAVLFVLPRGAKSD